MAERTYGGHPDTIAASMARGEEHFAERLARRSSDLLLQGRFVVASMPSALASMLLGMALWRSGLLAGDWDTARTLRLARWCVWSSLPVLAVLALWDILSGFDAIVTAANAIVLSAPFDVVLGTG